MESFISDLDGTLLNENCKISEYSISVINDLIDKGYNFSIATARSLSSVKDILEPLNLKLPIILNNGGFIYDPISNKNLVSNYMQNDISKDLIDEVVKLNFNPFVHLEANNENKLYYSGLFNYGEKNYYDSRMKANDKRFEKVKKYNVESGKVITIFLIGEEHQLTNLYKVLKEKYPVFQYHLFLDVYSQYYWIEINNINATKQNGVKFLKKHLNIENVTCFGDHLNDVSMFEECDNSYAVKNAHKDLKEMANEVIGSNIEDGVAKFLESRVIL